jgi:hypothetical protein
LSGTAARRVLPAALLVVLAALVAGCGGGTVTTVIERTVTEKVEAPSGSTKKATEQAESPRRTLHLQTFRTPSGNIGCEMFEGGARCDIRKREWRPAPRPAECPDEVGYGQGLEVPPSGEAAFVCAGDTALDPSAASLSYGTASRVGGSECISRADGVTCVNQAGHGFFISIQSYQVF